MRSPGRIAVVSIALAALVAVEVGDAWARARGGGGAGRGSRSYSAPARPAPTTPDTPTSPSRSVNQPAPAPAPVPRPNPFGGFLGPLTGFLLGGLIGGLLFGGLGHGLGIGLLDLLLIGGGIFLLMSFLRRRREQPVEAYAGAAGHGTAYAGAPARGAGSTSASSSSGRYQEPDNFRNAPTATIDPAAADLARGVGHIQTMDAGFDAAAFAAGVPAVFRTVQSALSARDVGKLRDELTPEMYAELHAQVDRLRSARQTNRVERVEIARSEVTEAWQEGGRDFVTVYLAGSLIDYVMDDVSGGVVDGSRTQPSAFEEFWTFTRPVGTHRWHLSAIQVS